jgi:predicted RND superfamily exporter protein
MGAFGIRFDFANIVALPLVPGIGVAAGVHLMHRCRQSAAEHGGVARIEDILRGTGTAVFVAATTTVFGFAGLMLADYGGMISLGLVMSIGTGSCLLGALIVQPALLVLVGRAR